MAESRRREAMNTEQRLVETVESLIGLLDEIRDDAWSRDKTVRINHTRVLELSQDSRKVKAKQLLKELEAKT